MAVLFIWKSMVKLLLFSQQRGILFLHFINIPQELSDLLFCANCVL